MRDLALADQRMGENLSSVRRAAAIEASLTAAEKDATDWELSDEDYALLRECFDKPSGKYNPQLGRLALPLIEYFMAAGAAGEE